MKTKEKGCNVKQTIAFNRNIFELKPIKIVENKELPTAFNRTILELKHNNSLANIY